MSKNEQDFSLKGLFQKFPHPKAAITLTSVGLLIYFNSLFNAFVLDDIATIVNNSAIRSLGNIPNFFLGLSYSQIGTGILSNKISFPYYRPLFISWLTVLYSLFKLKPFYYHFFQLTFHITNSYLVFHLFKKFLKPNLSLFLALLFLVHPINTESVVYISAMQEPLFLLFGLSSFLVLAKNKLSYKQLIAGGSLLLLSLLTKETGALLFFAILLYHFIYNTKSKFKVLLISTPALSLFLFLRFVVAKVYFTHSTIFPIVTAPTSVRLQTIPVVVIHYLKTFFYPKNLAVSQHWLVDSVTFSSFYLPLVINLFLFIVAFGLAVNYFNTNKNKFKPYLFFLLWFLSGIGLHMQIIPLDMTVAERWFYFPSVGLIGMLGVIFNNLSFKKISKSKIFDWENLVFTLSITILFLLSTRTIVRNFNWKTPLSLYSHDINVMPPSFDLESHLGVELYTIGRKAEAKEHFIKSTELVPTFWVSAKNLAAFYFNEGDYQLAEKYYQLSIENNKYYSDAYVGYAKLLLSHDQENGKKAKEFIEQSLKTLPNNGKLWLYLAAANYKLGLNEEALSAAEKAYTLSRTSESKYVYTQLLKGEPIQFE